MKKIIILILSSLFFIVSLDALAQKELSFTKIKKFGKNRGNLKMFVHHKNLPDTGKVPLVVVLHGCNQKAAGVAALTGWNKLAGINDFVVLYPQQRNINNPNLCFNWFKKRDIRKNKGECASIMQMINYCLKNYPIDTNNIFITGVSAGAAMSVAMMATYPDVFKMGAVFAGGAYRLGTNPVGAFRVMLGRKNKTVEKLTKNVRKQNPGYEGKYPPLIIYQGQSDPVVAPRNAHILAAQWAGLFQADTTNHYSENAYMGIDDITRREYHDTSGNMYMVMYLIEKLGHRVLVKPGDDDNEGGRTGLYGADKGFHSTYQTAKEFGIIKLQ